MLRCPTVYVAQKDLRAISRLSREVEEFPAGQSDQALIHCMEELTRIIGAANAFWVGATRQSPVSPTDKALGWRPASFRHLYCSEKQHRAAESVARGVSENIVDPHSQALVRRAGQNRACLRQELVDDCVWEHSIVYNELMRPFGIEDRLVGAHAVHGSAESYLGLDRGKGDIGFGSRERNLLLLFMGMCSAFHRNLTRQEAALLSPRERQVLAQLLTERGEKEIAQELGLTWRTTHQYAVSVMRKLNVSGRIGLMALFLRNGGAP